MTNENKLRSLVDQFVADLSARVHEEALETVRAALGQPAAKGKRGPGRPRKAGRAKVGRKPGRAKAGRRSADEVASMGDTVLSHVKANPGQRLEEIGRELGVATKELKRPIANLMGGGSLRTEGQKRGTKYFAGKGKGKGKGARRKAGKRRGGRRRKA
jgi:hypothetical protein